MRTNLIAALTSTLVVAFLTDAQAEKPLDPGPSEGPCALLFYTANTTPGLAALCANYCERRDCPDSGDPECDRLLGNYNRRRTENDPQMPCLEVCPCYTADEVRNHPVELTHCIQDFSERPFSAITDEAKTSGAGSGAIACMWSDLTVDPQIIRMGPVMDDNGAVCRAIVDAVIAERGLICDSIL